MNARDELKKLIRGWLDDFFSDSLGTVVKDAFAEHLSLKFDHVDIDVDRETLTRGWVPHALLTVATLDVRHTLESRVDKFPGVE